MVVVDDDNDVVVVVVAKARHTHTDSSVVNMLAITFFSWQLKFSRYMCVLHQPVCGHLASEKSHGRPTGSANYLPVDKLLANKSRYVYGGV